MTVKRLFAILFIFVSTTIAWFILGGSVVARTGQSNFAMSQAVANLWGGEHRQAAPTASFCEQRTVFETVTEHDAEGREVTRRIEKSVNHNVSIPLLASRISVDLELEHRRKGLLWHDTYEVAFHGTYRVVAPDDLEQPVRFDFTFPSNQAIYDEFTFRVDGEEAPPTTQLEHGLYTYAELDPGEEATVEIEYRSRGLDTWYYLFATQGVATVRDFELAMSTNFTEIDFPSDTLSPSNKTRTDRGWRLDWSFDNLVSGKAIGMDLPNRLNPGPLTARITFFAPVSLLFFVTVLIMLGVLQRLELHPVHYFFLSTAFFAFHLLLAYLVDHMSIHLAFAIASAVSILLVVSYLRLVCGTRRALTHAGAAQLVFLVLFSYAFFFEGYTGLTVTVGAVLTLFLLMQLTGRVDWERVFGRDRSTHRSEPARSPA
jgi:hypothetical protein